MPGCRSQAAALPDLSAAVLPALLGLALAGCFPLFDTDPEPSYVDNDTDDELPSCVDGRWTGDLDYNGLASAEAIEGCTYIQGDLRIDQTSTSHLDGLEYVTTVGGSVYVVDNDYLFDLDGLESLIEVEGDLVVLSNYSLTDLQGLEFLMDIGGDLYVEQNTNLRTILDLQKLRFLSGYSYTVAQNPELPTCEAEQLAQRLVDNGFTGTVEIYGNDDAATCE